MRGPNHALSKRADNQLKIQLGVRSPDSVSILSQGAQRNEGDPSRTSAPVFSFGREQDLERSERVAFKWKCQSAGIPPRLQLHGFPLIPDLRLYQRLKILQRCRRCRPRSVRGIDGSSDRVAAALSPSAYPGTARLRKREICAIHYVSSGYSVMRTRSIAQMMSLLERYFKPNIQIFINETRR